MKQKLDNFKHFTAPMNGHTSTYWSVCAISLGNDRTQEIVLGSEENRVS